jgi:hypothetical protein
MAETVRAEKIQKMKNDVDQKLNLVKIYMGESKFALGKNNPDQVIFLCDRSIYELQTCVADLRAMMEL